MGRHAPRSGGRRRRVRRALVAVALVAAAGAAVVAAGPGNLVGRVRAAAGSPGCTATVVRVAAAPAIAPAVRTALADRQQHPLADGTCLRVDVQGSTPEQVLALTRSTAADAAAVAALSELWIPDDTLWVERVRATVPVTVEKSLARSPVVLATSRAAVARLRWTAARPPTWAQAVAARNPVAVDLTSDTAGLATAGALAATIRNQTALGRALAALTLAVDNGTPDGGAAPLDLASTDAPATPLIPVTEQGVLSLRRSGNASLALVYPADGSPVLDFPLVRLAPAARTARAGAAVDAVSSALRAPAAASTFLAQGFRLPGRPAPAGDGVRTQPLHELRLPPAAALDRIVATLTALAAPTRMLALIDVSGSMQAAAGGGLTRIELVRDAASEALRLLPADDSVGAWVFARDLTRDGRTADHWPISAVDRLDAADDRAGSNGTHRQAILADLRALPGRTGGNGTAIYDTVDAAVREMQKTFDGGSTNVVVLLTDGTNVDRGGLTLDEAVARLQAGRGARNVRLITIGIGPDVDMAALRRLARATATGREYRALTRQDLTAVLFDALASRS